MKRLKPPQRQLCCKSCTSEACIALALSLTVAGPRYATDDNDEFEAPVEDEEEVLDEEVDDVRML